jgi:hypothetical protein
MASIERMRMAAAATMRFAVDVPTASPSVSMPIPR